MEGNLFTLIPKVDEVLEYKNINKLKDQVSREVILKSIREELDILRNLIKNNKIDREEIKKYLDNLPSKIETRILREDENNLKRTINCTGVVIHTNLGRSILNEKVMENIKNVTTNYSNLEFNLETGERGSRYEHLESLIVDITGGESALVVNNNAAAVLLVLSSLAKDKEIIVSRGELIEIGGSFRIPEVMEESGGRLVAVGTTNMTHLEDYERAITEDTGALLKVHTSNYKILGFTSEVDSKDLYKLKEKYQLPLIEDLGSGVLINLEDYGLEHEPTVQESLEKGVDIVTFSGDKLLGGPQAGIIVGKKEYIDRMKRNPLTRAFRIDKFTIAALEETLKIYLDKDSVVENIPTLNMILESIDEIERKANIIKEELERIDKSKVLNISLEDDYSQVGGGSLPLEKLPTKVLSIDLKGIDLLEFEKNLRDYEIPIITRIHRDNLIIDPRTIKEEEIQIITKAFNYALENKGVGK